MAANLSENLSARFRCIHGCDGSWSLTEVIYTCPSCGGLLEVAHNLEMLKKTSPSDWKDRFARRRGLASGLSGSAEGFETVADKRVLPTILGSGVWSKKEWVAPHVAPTNIVSTGEGDSALVAAPRYADELGIGSVLIKQCGTSHTGSFKDLGMTVLVSTVAQIIADGVHVPAIACASTGDTSAALAAYAAIAGIPALVILPRGKVSAAQLVQPLANGATVIAIDGDFDACMKIVKRLATNDGVYLANSMNSLRLEGQKTVAIEMAQQLGWQAPEWVVIPGGNLGNVSALGAGFQLMHDLGLIESMPRICVAQAERANPLYRAYASGWKTADDVVAGETLASAIRIGAPVSRLKAQRVLESVGGIVEQASESELAEASARADLEGFFCCPHTGVALAAVEKLAGRGEIGKSDRVVVVSTASGLKFTDFKAGYHASNLADVEARRPNRPIECSATYESVREIAMQVSPE